MKRSLGWQLLLGIGLVTLAGPMGLESAVLGQEAKPTRRATAATVAEQPTTAAEQPATAAEQPATAAAVPKEAAKKAFRGRLPAYYSKVVDSTQRQQIYEIQKEYASRISQLKAQLESLLGERDQQVTAVLTVEQREKVAQLRAEAQAKRKHKGKTDPPAAGR